MAVIISFEDIEVILNIHLKIRRCLFTGIHKSRSIKTINTSYWCRTAWWAMNFKYIYQQFQMSWLDCFSRKRTSYVHRRQSAKTLYTCNPNWTVSSWQSWTKVQLLLLFYLNNIGSKNDKLCFYYNNGTSDAKQSPNLWSPPRK